MTRDNYGNGIPGQGLSDGARLCRPTYDPSHFGIGPGFPRRNLERRSVHLPVTRCDGAQVQRNITKVLKIPTQIPADSLDDPGNGSGRRAHSFPAELPRDALFRGLRSCFRQLEEGHGRHAAGISGIEPAEPAGAEWRLKEAVGSSLHRNSLAAILPRGQ